MLINLVTHFSPQWVRICWKQEVIFGELFSSLLVNWCLISQLNTGSILLISMPRYLTWPEEFKLVSLSNVWSCMGGNCSSPPYHTPTSMLQIISLSKHILGLIFRLISVGAIFWVAFAQLFQLYSIALVISGLVLEMQKTKVMPFCALCLSFRCFSCSWQHRSILNFGMVMSQYSSMRLAFGLLTWLGTWILCLRANPNTTQFFQTHSYFRPFSTLITIDFYHRIKSLWLTSSFHYTET